MAVNFPKLPDNPDHRILSDFGHDPEAPAQRQIRKAKESSRIAATQAVDAVEPLSLPAWGITPPLGRIVRLTLPEAPSGNRYWRKTKNGRTYVSAEAQKYINTVRRLFAGEMLTGPIAVVICWYRGRKQGDLDNRNKVALDAMQGVIYEDDAQIVEIHSYRHEDKKNPRMEVIAWALP